MATNNNLGDFLTNLANHIRTKKGTSGTINAQNMASEIDSIQTGITPTGSVTLTTNGTHDVTNKASAIVNVPNPTLSGDATENMVLNGSTFYSNTYTKKTGTMANRGSANVDINSLVPVSISAGYYNGSGVLQISQTEQDKIIAGNIKSGVSILGVEGSIVEGAPIEISTSAGMTAVLVEANVGKVYKFTGTTDDTYTNGDLYEVEGTASASVNITLTGYNYETDYTATWIKLGLMPSHFSDYDYVLSDDIRDRGNNFLGYANVNISVDVPNGIVYLWGDRYKINNGAEISLVNDYTQATMVTLSEGDTLTLVAQYD